MDGAAGRLIVLLCMPAWPTLLAGCHEPIARSENARFLCDCLAGFACEGGVCVPHTDTAPEARDDARADDEGATCEPRCEGIACGPDGCGGSCGSCPSRHDCLGGECVCLPACLGRDCGLDGCGGVCGACSCGETCVQGSCRFIACDGLECGTNGCGGSCGACSLEEYCDAGLCQPKRGPGAVCTTDEHCWTDDCRGGICFGIAAVGQACTRDFQCASGTCFNVTEDTANAIGFCTTNCCDEVCDAPTDCGIGLVCGALNNRGTYRGQWCKPACDASQDCPFGMVCGQGADDEPSYVGCMTIHCGHELDARGQPYADQVACTATYCSGPGPVVDCGSGIRCMSGFTDSISTENALCIPY